MNGRSPFAARLLLTLCFAASVLGARSHAVVRRAHGGLSAPPQPTSAHILAATRDSQTPDAQPDQEDTVPPAAAASIPPASTVQACPNDMVRIEGSHCYYWEQVCLRWDDPDGQPAKRVCGEFQKPSVCKASRHPMLFCMDRDEYIAPGESVPAKAISWTQADMICASQGKRICTSLEWELACEGEEGLPYPYGYERSSALCNQDRLLRDGKFKASADLREAPHATCASPFGVRDMVGNVDEWVRMPGAKAPRRSELRGGWWMTGRNRCRANTSHHDEKYAGPQTGFRCCKDIPAASARSDSPNRPPRTARIDALAE